MSKMDFSKLQFATNVPIPAEETKGRERGMVKGILEALNDAPIGASYVIPRPISQVRRDRDSMAVEFDEARASDSSVPEFGIILQRVNDKETRAFHVTNDKMRAAASGGTESQQAAA